MRRLPFLLFPLLLFSACQDDDAIRTYRVYRDSTATPRTSTDMMSQGNALGLEAGGTRREISWTPPKSWTPLPATAMRVGSFRIQAKGGTAEVSVIPLTGSAGGDLANVNRWRSQIQLPPIDEDHLQRESHWIAPNGRRMRLVEFAAAPPGSQPKRLIAAIYTGKAKSWFFKMLGDDQAVLSAKSEFLAFLRSLRFHDAR